MRINKRLMTAIAACAVVVTAGAGAASAASITYTTTVGPQATDWSNTITVPRFNMMLGTLTSIDFALAGELIGGIHIQNNDGPTTVTSTLSAGLHLTAPVSAGGGGIVSANPSVTRTDSVAAGGTVDISGITASDTGNAHSTDTSLLHAFTGSTDPVLGVSSDGHGSDIDNGNIIEQRSISTSGTVTITQNYDPVPEPASLALIGLGLAGLGAAGRRRRK